MGAAAHVIPTVADTLEGDIQEALTICGGDAIAALRITLIANAFLEAQIDELKEQDSSVRRHNPARTALAADAR